MATIANLEEIAKVIYRRTVQFFDWNKEQDHVKGRWYTEAENLVQMLGDAGLVIVHEGSIKDDKPTEPAYKFKKVQKEDDEKGDVSSGEREAEELE